MLRLMPCKTFQHDLPSAMFFWVLVAAVTHTNDMMCCQHTRRVHLSTPSDVPQGDLWTG